MNTKKILIVFIVAFAIMIGIGCTDDSGLIDDYNNHMDTYNQDMNTLELKVENFETATSMALVDDDITSEEINQLIEQSDKIIDESNLVLGHLNNFKSFINANEQELKNAGVDTFNDKKQISDYIVELNSVIDDAKSFTSEMKLLAEELNKYE